MNLREDPKMPGISSLQPKPPPMLGRTTYTFPVGNTSCVTLPSLTLLALSVVQPPFHKKHHSGNCCPGATFGVDRGGANTVGLTKAPHPGTGDPLVVALGAPSALPLPDLARGGQGKQWDLWRWVRLLFGREFPLQDLLVVWDALFADSITLNLVDYIFVAMLLYIRDALISSNYQTCLGLLMHYPPIGDVHSLILRALFLRDPKRNPRPVTHQFQQNLDYYKARGADLMNKTRASAKAAPLNINKVSNSLLNFGRKLIAPAMASGGAGAAPAGGSSFPPPAMPIRSAVEAPQHHHHHQSQQQRMMKSESMPVQLGKGEAGAGSDAAVPGPGQHPPALPGQSSKNISSSPSIESLSGGREFTGSPPLSASKKDSFFSTISRSRSQSKTMSRKESEEELEAQISFLQGQLNDLEAMCKYCAKMMNTHLGNIQEVILQEHLEKEDEILVSLAGLKQIKDILKGSLRFNQSQLEAEENEQITIADDHYCSNSQNKGTGDVLKGPVMTKQQFISGQQ
ncbi:PREDICTED: TBC1 domain family member 5-like, partial [Phaethon lepturus]|uniref:TBC1 domain family member 5-like n=1 Tax=Phaethon lepturus TaxID=97097 RepID=UPI0005308430